MNTKRVCLLLLIVTILSGCATMIRGSRQTITITSDPPGAKVWGSGSGVTPLKANVRRKGRTATFYISKEGYISEKRMVKSQHAGGLGAGNLALTAMASVGMMVDGKSGANYVYKPSKIHVKLRKLTPEIQARLLTVNIVDFKTIPAVVPPDSEFGFDLLVNINDGASLETKIPVEITYSILHQGKVVFEDTDVMQIQQKVEYMVRKRELTAGDYLGEYQLKVNVKYKNKQATDIARFIIN